MKIYIHQIKWDKNTKIEISEEEDENPNELAIVENVIIMELEEDNISPEMLKKLNKGLKKHNLEVITDKDGNVKKFD